MGKIINEGGINGTGQGVVNINSQDYKELQKAIQGEVKKHDTKKRIRIGLISIRLQMENYASDELIAEIIWPGYYLKQLLHLIGITNKEFADFIGLQEPNLSSILNGRRKINTELAYKLGKTFDLDPNLWLVIQSKNELIEINRLESQKFKDFRLSNLLKKVG